GEREREELDHLIHSAEIKQMEITRVYSEVASYWGDYKGPDKASTFTQERYPETLRRYESFLERQEEYLEKHPIFGELLEGWTRIPTRERVKGRSQEELTAIIEDLDIPEATKTFFQEAIQYDPNLTRQARVPLYQLIRRIQNPHGRDDSLELWRPMDEYLAALRALRRWTSREDIQGLRRASEVAVELDIKEPVQESSNLRQAFSERLQGQPEKIDQAEKDLAHYLRAADRLRIQLAHFEPDKGLVRPVSWGEVRGQLGRLRRGRRISKGTVEKILQWTEERLEDVPNSILVGYRNEFIPGMLETIFSESRTASEQKNLARFLDEICARDDVEMMTNLAIRFHNYRFGDLGPESNAHPGGTVGETHLRSRQEIFLNNLLATAEFYGEHPNFRGAYFEIVENLNNKSRTDAAALVSPIQQQIAMNLEAGHAVRLISRGGMGVGVLQVREGKSERNLGITSIQERVVQRAQFNFWINKLYRELQTGSLWEGLTQGSGQLHFQVYLPKFRSVLEKEDAVYWARDLLTHMEGVAGLTLYVPKTNSAVRDVLDSKQYEAVNITRESPTTAERVEILERELEESSDDVFRYLSLFRLHQTLDPVPSVHNRGLDYLSQALWRFPKNKAVKTEMRKALGVVYQDMEGNRRTKLSDFTEEDLSRNQAYERRRVWRLQQAGLLPAESNGKAYATLGTPEHFQSVARLFELVLGRDIPLFPLERWFDISAAGFRGENFRFRYDPNKLSEISLEMDITADQLPLPFQITERPKVIPNKSANPGVPPKGTFGLTIKRDRNGNFSLSVPQLRLPPEWQMAASGTLLIRRLMSFGDFLGAKTLDFKEASTGGKLALLKLGGRIKQEGLWNILRDGFPAFVERYAAEHGLWGMDNTPASQIKNPQDIAYAYFDRMENRLRLTPWFAPEPDGTKITHVDPHYEVGRHYLLQEPTMEWDVAFDLRPGSQTRRIFSQYFQHRFRLQEGEEL
ncbi:MAG: hypothetical protein R3257_01100, partial [bacterium]|nr:hypothetical protein [bacterium]